MQLGRGSKPSLGEGAGVGQGKEGALYTTTSVPCDWAGAVRQKLLESSWWEGGGRGSRGAIFMTISVLYDWRWAVMRELLQKSNSVADQQANMVNYRVTCMRLEITVYTAASVACDWAGAKMQQGHELINGCLLKSCPNLLSYLEL